jgi:outer membrane protein assembly factor BamB
VKLFTRGLIPTALGILMIAALGPVAWAAAPKISKFTPTSGTITTKVTLTGSNFLGAKSVKFGAASATFHVASATKITTAVPSAASTGKISVTTPGGTAKSATNFNVLPSISSFTPASATIGSTVTITGGGFIGTTSVTFNGLAATHTVNSANQITATVPAGATTGAIGVNTPAGGTLSGASFTVIPKITSFSPSQGAVGTSVVITGSGFNSATGVTFNGVSASFLVNSSTQITATVPTTFSGVIAVTTTAGTAVSATSFTVLPSVVLDVTSGPPTTTVNVSGLGFGANETVDVYFDATEMGLAGTASDGTFSGVSFNVPASATPGAHKVSAVGRRDGAFAKTTFTVETDWAMFRNTPSHRGNNPYENVVGTSNVGDLFQSWSANLNGAPTSPAVVDGSLYSGSANGDLYALDASTGSQLWSFAATAAINSSPAVSNGVVYVASSDGKLWAVNTSDGSAFWGSPVTLSGTSNSSPTISGGIVYIGTTTNVYAIDATTGSVDWTAAPGAGSFSGTSPALANGSVVYTSSTGHVLEYASGAGGGALQWNANPGGSLTTPAIVSGSIYVGSGNGNFYALSLASGATQWSQNPSAVPFASAPAYAGGFIYAGSNDGTVYQYDTTGGNAWNNGNGAAYRSPIAVANGVVYAGSNDNGIYAFNASNGNLLWSGSTNGTVTQSPVMVNGTLYVPSNDGHIYAYALSGGV